MAPSEQNNHALRDSLDQTWIKFDFTTDLDKNNRQTSLIGDMSGVQCPPPTLVTPAGMVIASALIAVTSRRDWRLLPASSPARRKADLWTKVLCIELVWHKRQPVACINAPLACRNRIYPRFAIYTASWSADCNQKWKASPERFATAASLKVCGLTSGNPQRYNLQTHSNIQAWYSLQNQLHILQLKSKYLGSPAKSLWQLLLHPLTLFNYVTCNSWCLDFRWKAFNPPGGSCWPVCLDTASRPRSFVVPAGQQLRKFSTVYCFGLWT